jgi:23S rRNA (guanine745-N1)-methyltransferase
VTFKAIDILCCPLDQQPLLEHAGSLQCASGHSFDIARRGYVNLLAASEKRSKDPGDSREMVSARGEFLDAGHYLPIARKLNELLKVRLNKESVLVDAGCGEGYYLQQLSRETGTAGPTIIGFDISKWAVQAAARRLDTTWLVASNRNVPVVEHSVDGGEIVLVSAGPKHLYELREVIYPTVKTVQSAELPQAEAAGFHLQESTALQYQSAPLSQPEIAQLLHMTPHLFRASREGKEQALALDNFSVTVDVVFNVLRCEG